MFIENQNTELKLILTRNIKKEIVAFANTNDGRIYIGINDNGEVIGVQNPQKELEALSGMIKEGIKSDLTLFTSIYIEQINGKDIIVVNVKEGPNKPYYLADKGLKPSGVYLRHGNVTVPADEEIIKKMLIENRSSSFEEELSTNQDLHFEYLKSILEKQNIEFNENKLKTLNIINLENKYTNLGLLLSDECPFSIKASIFSGKDKLEFSDRKEFNGSILKQAEEIFDYLNLFNKVKGEIIDLLRVDTYDYPKYALREAILNAIIHRDYNFNGSILVSLFIDRIEVSSLGGLLKGLTIEDIYNGISETRNPKLANVFYRLKYVESFGTGIDRIMSSYVNNDKQPVISISDNVFKITLYNRNYTDYSFILNEDTQFNPFGTSKENLIIYYLKHHKTISRLDAERVLGLSKTRTSEILKNMVNDGMLTINGNGKTTNYSLKNRG